MPSGGVTNSGSGLRLQAVTPGTRDNGNANINGMMIAAVVNPVGPDVVANTTGVTNGPDVNVVIGAQTTQIPNATGGPWGGICIGGSSSIGQNAINNQSRGNIAIGNQAVCKNNFSIALGQGAVNGDDSGGGQAAGIAIGNAATIKNWYGQSAGQGNIVIGPNAQSIHVPGGAFYAGMSIVIGATSRANVDSNGPDGWGAGGYGFSTIIGEGHQALNAVNLLILDTTLPYPAAVKTYTNADSNRIIIGNGWHRSITIAGKKLNNLPGVAFVQTASVTVGNTAAETTLIGAGKGSTTIPANTLKAGDTVKVKFRGYITNTGTPTLVFRVKIGATAYIVTTANPMGTLVGTHGIKFDSEICIRTEGAGGSAIGQGDAWVSSSAMSDLDTTNNATTAIDTTAALTVDVTAQWGTANVANTLTVTNLTLKY